ncbi:MAG: hypothetical protein QMB24_15925 [Spirosomataceae bacterium]
MSLAEVKPFLHGEPDEAAEFAPKPLIIIEFWGQKDSMPRVLRRTSTWKVEDR